MVGRILTGLFATYANILSPLRSTVPYDTASLQSGCSPTDPPLLRGPSSSVLGFSPGKFSAHGNLTSELLRYL